MQTTSVWISGLGAVSPYGLGVDPLWQGLLEGRDVITPLTLFDPSGFIYQRGGQVDPEAEQCLRHRWPGVADRGTLFALAAVDEALRHAGLDEASRQETALVSATNFGGLATGESLLAAAAGCVASTPDDEAFRAADMGDALTVIRQRLGLEGPAAVLSLSCASGAAALGRAAEWILARRARRVVVVGYDSLSRFAWSGLCALRTMSTDAVRPFDRRRSGTIFSEGAAALVVESTPSLHARNGESLARLSGWATGNNGTHMTAPAPGGAGSADVLRRALWRAGIEPDAVDHVNAHGTGTPLNDPTEAEALHTVLGAHAAQVPVTSIKGAVGHLMGAAGSAEALVSVLTLRSGLVPPTAHHEERDEACPLDIVTGEPRRIATVRHVLSNSAGIGGTNAAVALSAGNS